MKSETEKIRIWEGVYFNHLLVADLAFAGGWTLIKETIGYRLYVPKKYYEARQTLVLSLVGRKPEFAFCLPSPDYEKFDEALNIL